MPDLVARYPYVKTVGGAKPIVWIGLWANDLFTPVPASFVPARMRTGISPRAGGAVNFSDSQAVELQFLTRDGEPVGRRVTVVPELDPRLDEPATVAAPAPWFQYEQLALAQDFLEQFGVVLAGSREVTLVYEN